MQNNKLSDQDILQILNSAKYFNVSEEVLQDACNIANNTYNPLTGFLKSEDFFSVLDKMRLKNNKIWPIPLVIDIDEKEFQEIKNEDYIVLSNKNSNTKSILTNIEIYKYDKKEYAQKVFQTVCDKHPGVVEIMNKKEYLLGGDIIYTSQEKQENEFLLTPRESKQIFQDKGWKTIVAFQTRNTPHRSHEFLQKKALSQVDGLFIQPIFGQKKKGDFKNEVVLESYKILLQKYYPQDKYVLGVLPAKMHYAGPREAVLHAIIRRNFGCTHMIIGRDHAGVGDYYDKFAAQDIFDQFEINDLGIKIMKYCNVHYCNSCNGLTLEDECNHPESDKFFLSGTKIREIINNKEILPDKLIRPEISEFLINHPDPFI